jgi:GNAT superfamily N-acetyltransferase
VPPPQALIIRPLRSDDTLTGLSLGTAESQPLKSFLRTKAIIFEAARLARTYVLVDEAHTGCGSRVWGYVTLVACDVQTTTQNKPADVDGWLEKHNMPAVKLARLAVDSQLQGKGYGRQFLDWTLAFVMDHVSSRIGCRLLVTDAKQQSVDFYKKCGFTILDTEANLSQAAPLMFVHLPKLNPQEAP